MNPVTPTMSVLQQAQNQQAVLQPQNNPLPDGQQPPQQAQQTGSNPLEQAFMQFLQQQHAQQGSQQSFLHYLPWFSQPQQQQQKESQHAFQPPHQQSAIQPQAGSGQDLASRETQNQVNRGGDQTSRFSTGFY